MKCIHSNDVNIYWITCTWIYKIALTTLILLVKLLNSCLNCRYELHLTLFIDLDSFDIICIGMLLCFWLFALLLWWWLIVYAFVNCIIIFATCLCFICYNIYFGFWCSLWFGFYLISWTLFLSIQGLKVILIFVLFWTMRNIRFF